MNIKDFKKHSDWVKMWSARGSLHFDSHLGEIWTKKKNISGRPMYAQVIFLYKNGVTDCWATKSDRDDLGNRLISLARHDESYIVKIAGDLQSCAEKVSAFIDSHDVGKINLADLDQFWTLVYDYYLPHVSVKYVVDYATPDELKKMLPILEKARLSAEPIYRNIENYVELIADRVAKEVSYEKEMILAATKEELRSYFQTKELPPGDQLKKRYDRSSIFFDENSCAIFVGTDVDEVEGIVSSQAIADVIEGQTAYAGVVRGRVKIVLNPSEANLSFQKGEILVTGMTRPEFLPLLERAAGFITDSGGILSHAAISARELKKPCITGTKIATQVLKDGDVVEVDADKGTDKIIERR
jgi:phosphohistidine swiveling domain-containing protein